MKRFQKIVTKPATALLDLFSTSQNEVETCAYRAPYFAYETASRHWTLAQGNCHHWDCPKCGKGRAKQEYGRIVSGCRELEKEHSLYFVTITCKGLGLSVTAAMQGYGKWTNHLLTVLRADCKKRGLEWAYVQVTEQQGRGHPHSHILTTWYPDDLTEGFKSAYTASNDGKTTRVKIPCLRSQYLAKCVVRAGLGEQYDISKVDKVEGASRYVAKYLFHPSMFLAAYPKGWKRIRYSQGFPELPTGQNTVMVLVTREHWRELAQRATFVKCADDRARVEANYYLRGADIVLSVKTNEL